MRRLLPIPILCAAALAQEGFQPLFNGKNLDGWDGDPRLWSVVDGAIQGSTEGVTLEHNSFLITKRKYSNFILRAQMKLRNHNSGIQFRSQVLPEWVVGGYQMDASEDNYWGNIYEERGKRGILVDSYKEKGSKVVRLKDWNDVEILCQGDHLQVKLNGTVTADLHDSAAAEGVIALQLHRGPPMQVWFRNIAIKELK
jgi:3-keto-disaccharide hydrolase